MARLTKKFTALKTQLEEVTYALCHCQERMEELQRSVSANDVRLKKLEKSEQEVVNLQATVSLLQKELNTQAQQNLLNEFEIIGIPENRSENLDHIVKVASTKIGLQLEDEDIDWVTRVGARRPLVETVAPESGDMMPRPIVVRLLRRSKRSQIIKAAKSRRNLTSSDLDIKGPMKKVFFNERLTKENRMLFREARARAKSYDYSFCWCNQGAIYIRKGEGKPAHLIQSLPHLDRILPAPPVDVAA